MIHPTPSPRPNLWLLTWTLPVFLVLLWLPVEQELEDARLHFGERASLEARLKVLSKHPDFVVHAASSIRLMGHPSRHPEYSPSVAHCVRITASPGAKPLNRQRIKNIRIVGERNSGVQLLRSDLARAFKNVTVEAGVTRWVYWFQDPTLARFVEGHNPERSVVIHIAAEPYEWMSRMQENPIHAPYHRRPAHGGPSWTNDSFFTRPWTLPRPDWDEPLPHSGHCQYRFPVGGVVPCAPGKLSGNKASKLYPVYEMNPISSKPFANIARFRSAKLANFLNMSMWMPHTIHVRSADVQSLRGVNSLVADLVDKYHLQGCEVRRDKKVSVLSSRENLKALSWEGLSPVTPHSWNMSAPPLSPVQQRWVTCNLDWHVEALLGFFPKEDPHTCAGGALGEGGPMDFSSKGDRAAGDAKPRDGFFYKLFDGIAAGQIGLASKAPGVATTATAVAATNP